MKWAFISQKGFARFHHFISHFYDVTSASQLSTKRAAAEKSTSQSHFIVLVHLIKSHLSLAFFFILPLPFACVLFTQCLFLSFFSWYIICWWIFMLLWTHRTFPLTWDYAKSSPKWRKKTKIMRKGIKTTNKNALFVRFMQCTSQTGRTRLLHVCHIEARCVHCTFATIERKNRVVEEMYFHNNLIIVINGMNVFDGTANFQSWWLTSHRIRHLTGVQSAPKFMTV